MRILTFSNFYDTHGGGLERVAAKLCREFAREGHEASWAASDQDGLPDSPAKLVPLDCINPTERLTGLPMPIPKPRSMRALYVAVRDSDIVILHDALYVGSILAMIFARRMRKPAVLIQHIGSIEFRNSVLALIMRLANRLVTRPMMKAADRLVFISATVREELAPEGSGIASVLTYNGIDAGIFNRVGAGARERTRTQWQLPADKPVAVFVGRFVEKKGLSIIREIARLRPDISFALVGQGPINPRGWGLANVQCLGQLEPEALADIYRASDMLLLPSVGEGYPLVVQEAMACGLPVVTAETTTRADPDASVYLAGVKIELADPLASARRCSEAMDEVLGAGADREAMSRYALATYDWGAMAREVLGGLAARASSPEVL